jgi:hypothetical protein
LFVDNFDEFFVWAQRVDDSPAGGCIRDVINEFPDNIDIYVCLDHGFFDHGEPLAHVGFGKFSFATQNLKGGLKAILE